MMVAAVLVVATAGCAGGRITPASAGDRPASGRKVTLTWAWGACLKSVDGLVAIDRVRRHFAADPRVEVTTVFLDRASPERVESMMAKRGVRLPWRPDPDCRLCRQMPARFWADLPPAEFEETLSRARTQLSKWLRMEPPEVEAVIETLRARATR